MLKCGKNKEKSVNIIWRCARVVWIIIIEMAAVNFLLLGTESCIALKRTNVCIYYLFFFVWLQITHVCIVRLSDRSFACSLVCSLDHLTRTSAAKNFLSINLLFCCYWLLRLLRLQLLFLVDVWSILVRWSIEFRWLGSKNHSSSKKWCELYARVSMIWLGRFFDGQFKRRHIY